MRISRLCASLILAIPLPAWAELPLTVENLITDAGKLRMELSLAYANTDRAGISIGEPIIVQTGPTSFITVPTSLGESLGNSDTVVGTLGLRYGLTTDTELYARISGLSSNQRNSGVDGTTTSSESRFVDAWVGINYQFKQDDDGPAVLGFAEIALREKHRQDSASLKSAMLGVTAYHAIDPILFSLTAAYQFNRARADGSYRYQPGNLLLLNPSVGFAVNDRVTLTAGAQWTYRQADRLDGHSQGINRTSTDLLLGAGYGLTSDSTLTTTLKANVSGRSGSELRANWLYTF